VIRESAFWLDDFPRPDDLPVAGLPARVDVAVVGAGFTGLNAALRLVRSGASVAVLDAGRIGAGASSVNAGMLVYGLKPSARSLLDRYGQTLGMELWNASLAAVNHVAHVVASEGIDCEFQRSGAVELGFTERDLRGFRAESAWMDATLGFHTRVVESPDIGSVVGSEAFRCAVVDDVSGGLHPSRYTFGLADVAARAGAVLVEQAEVFEIARSSGAYRLGTARGALAAGEVLVATNGYTGSLVPHLRRGVVPIGSYVVTTEPLGADMAARLVPGGRMLWTSRRFVNYFRTTGDHRLLLGGRQDLSTDLDLGASAAALRRTITSFFPELNGVGLTHTWTGRLGATFDLLPHIGRIDGVWFALGYGGHGVGLGSYLGNESAGLITGETARSPFFEIALPTRWFYRRRPWFLPVAARWFRILDRLGA
jgi:glycine/D-amino acid oxidase-like deaminating enzyme